MAFLLAAKLNASKNFVSPFLSFSPLLVVRGITVHFIKTNLTKDCANTVVSHPVSELCSALFSWKEALSGLLLPYSFAESSN